MILTSFHGTHPEAPLVGGQDIVSARQLQVLWASNSYDLAAQFQDGQVRKLAIELQNPLIIDESTRAIDWEGQSMACIVDRVQSCVSARGSDHDGVIFPDTVDGMEVGDVIAVFSRPNSEGVPSVDHAVKLLATREYDDELDDWVSPADFFETENDTLSISPAPTF